jgi:hypothetical protein
MTNEKLSGGMCWYPFQMILSRAWRQDFVRKYYKSTPFSLLVAVLIIVNFAATATDAQLGPMGLQNADGSKNGIGQFLVNLDMSFTAIFTMELLINMFAHWFWEVR